MTAEEKAKELIEKMMPHAYCLKDGSGFDEAVQVYNAKESAQLAIQEIFSVINESGHYPLLRDKAPFWAEVRMEVDKYQLDVNKVSDGSK